MPENNDDLASVSATLTRKGGQAAKKAAKTKKGTSKGRKSRTGQGDKEASLAKAQTFAHQEV
jgi:hypothetical protein